MEPDSLALVGVRTDPGRDPTKRVNEDAVGHAETKHGHLVVVCDGMGGHEGGREASTRALAAVLETFEQAPESDPAHEVLARAVRAANTKVAALSPTSDPADRPGSTVVAIVVHAGGTEVAHIGDSRLYGITGGQIAQLTKDHSVVQEMVDRGLLSPDRAKDHPDANRITRALGTRESIEVDLRPAALLHAAGDVFVLCTDGLSDLVTPDDILRLATSASPEQAAGQLVDLANARGGHDNVTVAVVRVKESAVPRAGMVAKTVAQTIAEEAPLLLVSPRPTSATLEPPASTRRPFPLGVVLGIALVVVGLLGAAAAVYLDQRSKHTHTVPSASAFVAPSSPSPRTGIELGAPTPPTATETSDDPIAPLVRIDAGKN